MSKYDKKKAKWIIARVPRALKKQLSTKYHLKRHTKLCHEKRDLQKVDSTFQCNYCDEVFASMVTLKSHISIIHEETFISKCT